MKHPAATWVVVFTLALAIAFDFLTPPGWVFGLVYLVPMAFVIRNASEKVGLAVICAVVVAVLADWLWFSWPLRGDAQAAVNAALVLTAVLCTALLGRRIKRLDLSHADEAQMLLDFSPSPLLLLDINHTVRAANDQSTALWGDDREALIGHNLEELLPAAEAETWAFDLQRDSRRVSTELRGAAVVLQVNHRVSVVHGERWILLELSDVTHQQRAKQALVEELEVQLSLNRERDAQLTSILDHAGALIAIKDIEGRYVAVNKHLLEMWGVPESHFVGRTDLEVAMDAKFGRWLHETDMAIMANGETLAREEQFPRLPDCTYYTTRFPITDRHGDVIGLGGISIDVTELHRANEVIEQQKASLQRSNADLERYAHMASHDLQEPLRMMVNFAELLEQSVNELDEESAAYLGFIVDNAKRGQALVRELLEYALLNGDRDHELVDLNEAASEAKRTAMALFPQAVVEIEDLPRVSGVAKYLELLMEHLIVNGLKFNRDESPRVTVSAEQDDDAWVFRFKDNGIGLDPGYLKRVFDVFTRLEGRGEFSGTGVGLAICRRVMELHGGRIEVEATSDDGSTFTCTLPKAYQAVADTDHALRIVAG